MKTLKTQAQVCVSTDCESRSTQLEDYMRRLDLESNCKTHKCESLFRAQSEALLMAAPKVTLSELIGMMTVRELYEECKAFLGAFLFCYIATVILGLLFMYVSGELKNFGSAGATSVSVYVLLGLALFAIALKQRRVIFETLEKFFHDLQLLTTKQLLLTSVSLGAVIVAGIYAPWWITSGLYWTWMIAALFCDSIWQRGQKYLLPDLQHLIDSDSCETFTLPPEEMKRRVIQLATQVFNEAPPNGSWEHVAYAVQRELASLAIAIHDHLISQREEIDL